MGTEVIQAEYNKLNDIAGRFAKSAENTADMRLRVERSVDALRGGAWEGEGATAFLAEMDGTVFPIVTRLTQALEQAQSVTLQVKDILQAAEEEGKRPFNKDNHNQTSKKTVPVPASTTRANNSSISLSSIISNTLKGIAANALLPQRYIFKTLKGGTTVAALMDMFAGKPGKGVPLIRFDGAHGGHNYPHINLASKLTGFKDPHIPISPKLLNVVGKGARIFEGIQKVAVPLAITIDVFRVGSAFHNDGHQVGSQTKQTVGSVAGGWGGAFVGAKIGAVSGAWFGGLVGSAVPALGTVVGAGVGSFLGGVIGGIGGGLGGSELGEMLGGLF